MPLFFSASSALCFCVRGFRMSAASQFLRDAASKSADLMHREIIRKGVDNYWAGHMKGRQRFLDWEAARHACHQIKQEAVSNLDKYLLQFEEGVRSRGGHVFWAADSAEACEYIRALAVSRGVKTVVKSKSMVTEEISLAPVLEREGIAVWETDLGEYIVQLRHEPPYHIVTPAMHLNRDQIAALFKEKIEPELATNDPVELVAVARRALRKAFFAAEMGISGANFIVADAGAVAVSTNEGNGRLTTSVPRIHVCVTGIEKVIPRLTDLAVLWPVLATSGTGQPITTYSTLISGPRQPGEADGPEEFHVVLVDNGRSALLDNDEQREVLHCIRCGACLNVCPVFRHIGGHAYGTIYPGPIGSVLTPHLRGPEFDHLAYASSLCGACTSVCPVQINLHHHLLHNRRDSVEQWDGVVPAASAGKSVRSGESREKGKLSERLQFKLFRFTMTHPGFYRFGASAGKRSLRLLYAFGLRGTALDPMREWNRQRASVPLPSKSFRAMWKDIKQ